jgi:hypothetical protein
MRSRLVPVLLSAALLVGGANLAAYAANGSPLLLGHKNTATHTTTLKNSKGTALSLKAKSTSAPFKVSNSTKVTKLNADLVDGLDSTALQTQSYVYDLSGTAASNIIRFTLPGLPPGVYQAAYSLEATNTGTTFFGCLFDSGAPFANARVVSLGAKSASWFISGAGVLDTRALTFTFTCEASTAGVTIGGGVPVSSQVILTRVDQTVEAGTVGAKGSSARGFGG